MNSGIKQAKYLIHVKEQDIMYLYWEPVILLLDIAKYTYSENEYEIWKLVPNGLTEKYIKIKLEDLKNEKPDNKT